MTIKEDSRTLLARILVLLLRLLYQSLFVFYFSVKFLEFKLACVLAKYKVDPSFYSVAYNMNEMHIDFQFIVDHFRQS